MPGMPAVMDRGVDGGRCSDARERTKLDELRARIGRMDECVPVQVRRIAGRTAQDIDVRADRPLGLEDRDLACQDHDPVFDHCHLTIGTRDNDAHDAGRLASVVMSLG